MLPISDLDKDYIPKETLYEADLPEKYEYLKEKFEEKEIV